MANNGSGTVSEFDSSGNLLHPAFISGLNGPEDLAFDHSGNLYVANSVNNTVSEYDSSGNLI